MAYNPETVPATKADIEKLVQMIFDLSLSVRAISLVASNPEDEKFINETRSLVKKVTDQSAKFLIETSRGES
jgi:uncharacterized protein YgbK (DUF1537 family)